MGTVFWGSFPSLLSRTLNKITTRVHPGMPFWGNYSSKNLTVLKKKCRVGWFQQWTTLATCHHQLDQNYIHNELHGMSDRGLVSPSIFPTHTLSEWGVLSWYGLWKQLCPMMVDSLPPSCLSEPVALPESMNLGSSHSISHAVGKDTGFWLCAGL